MKINSISLLALGVALLGIAMYVPMPFYIKCSLLVLSIVISIYAAVRSFKEKKDNNL